MFNRINPKVSRKVHVKYGSHIYNDVLAHIMDKTRINGGRLPPKSWLNKSLDGMVMNVMYRRITTNDSERPQILATSMACVSSIIMSYNDHNNIHDEFIDDVSDSIDVDKLRILAASVCDESIYELSKRISMSPLSPKDPNPIFDAAVKGIHELITEFIDDTYESTVKFIDEFYEDYPLVSKHTYIEYDRPYYIGDPWAGTQNSSMTHTHYYGDMSVMSKSYRFTVLIPHPVKCNVYCIPLIPKGIVQKLRWLFV